MEKLEETIIRFIAMRVVDKLEQLTDKYGEFNDDDIDNYVNLYTKGFKEFYNDIYASVIHKVLFYLNNNYME